MREIIIDTDTVVGYDYELKKFYVTNKDTTTFRTTNTGIKAVLNIVAPNNTVSLNDLTSLATNMESLKALYYTWEDTGAYIKTIQFNEYKKYPLVLDGKKSKLYIMNTQHIFDLTLKEGERERLIQLRAFYKDTLGLLIELVDMRIIYRLLVSFYNPTCYNELQSPTAEELETGSYTLKFSNILKLSNYRGTSPATYTCTYNPTNQYDYNTIGNIIAIEENIITLTTTVPSRVKVGTQINLSNTNTTVDTTTYSADGTYTVQSIQGNQIFTTENLPASFTYNPPIVEIVAYKSTISSINREDNSITLTNSANNFLIGDTIMVEGATINTEYETLSDNGEYVIIGIEGNKIYTSETPTFNYTGTTSYVYKAIKACTVQSISNKVITTEEDIPSTLTVNTPICVHQTIGEQEKREYATVTALASKKITVGTNLTSYTAKYGLLRELIPYTYVLTLVEGSNKEDVLPNGYFMVDTPNQAIDYLSLLPNLVVPTMGTQTGRFALMGTEVPTTYTIDTTTTGINKMGLLGLYSKVYADTNEE